jgi:rod shape-determining protein MreC
VVFWKRRGVPALLVTCGLSLLLILSGDGAQFRVARLIEGFLLGPAYRLFGVVGGGVQALSAHQDLERRVAELATEKDLFVERGLENQRLRRLLGFTARAGVELVPAEVMRHDAGLLGETIVVRSSSPRGAAVGQAVISADGLVGRVVEVHPGLAHVLIIRSVSNPVSARIQRSRVLGTLRWDPSRPGTLDLLHVPAHADCEVGDIAVSSGLGAAYPEGLRVGEVLSVERDFTGLMKEIRVRPAVDFSRLEEVFLVRLGPGETDLTRLYAPAAPDSAR